MQKQISSCFSILLDGGRADACLAHQPAPPKPALHLRSNWKQPDNGYTHFLICLTAGGAEAEALPRGEMRLSCRLVPGYPSLAISPLFSLRHGLLSHELPVEGATAVAAAARRASAELLQGGETSVIFAAVMAANEALAAGAWRGEAGASQGVDPAAPSSEDEGESDGEQLDEQQRKQVIERMTAEAIESVGRSTPAEVLGVCNRHGADGAPQSLRGQWHFRVGLVGKPSAGRQGQLARTHGQ